MKELSKADMHPADQALYEEGLFDPIINPPRRHRKEETSSLQTDALLKGFQLIADSLRAMPAPVVNVAAPNVQVTVNPELRIPTVVESTRLLRNERGLLTGSVKEIEPKPE